MTDTMTSSSKRAEANRRNAQKSTGPKTAEGKARSRFNAVKHGMRAALPILPGEDGGVHQARLDAWTADLKPADEVERFLVGRAVQLSWQLERADRAQAAHSAELGTQAADHMAGLAEEVASLGRRLFWDPRGPNCLYPNWKPELRAPTRVSWSGVADDPDDPARLLCRLEASAMGAAWLLDRWAELRALLESGQFWQPPDRFRAIRLLGRQPMDALEDERVLSIYLACAAMEPDPAARFGDLTVELDPHEEKRLIDRINVRLASQAMPADAEDGRTALLGLVDEEEGRLEEILAILLERGAPALESSGFDNSPEGDRLRRYQLSCERALLRVLETLRKRRREAEAMAMASAAPPRKPAPAPKKAEEPMNPASRLSGLLSIIAEAQAAKAANKANAPTTSTAPQAAAPARVEPRPAAEGAAGPTNEANRPIETPPRPAAGGIATFLMMLALFFGIGITAAARQTVVIGRPASPPDSGRSVRTDRSEPTRRLAGKPDRYGRSDESRPWR